MLAGDRDRLLAAARTEKDPDLRGDAIHLLGISGGRQQLIELYRTESSRDLRESIVHALFINGAADQLADIAKTDTDPEVRLAAIHSLGLTGDHNGDVLRSLYSSQNDRRTREAVIQALFLQNNAHALIDIARKETDPELKRSAVSKLALIHSPEATQYMMELLNK
jgi:HEAT repeat protein